MNMERFLVNKQMDASRLNSINANNYNVYTCTSSYL